MIYPVPLCIKPPRTTIPLRPRPLSHRRLIVLPMAHDIRGDLRRSHKDDLPTRRVALGILDAGERPRCEPNTVKDDPGGFGI
jgi:hypothetical protein